MEILDVILIIPLIYGAYKGYKRGFVMSLFLLLAVFVGLYVSFHFTDPLVKFGLEQFHWKSKYLSSLIFLILFIMVGAAVYFAGKLLESAIKLVKLSLLNSLAGGILGLVQWIFFVGSILLMVLSFDQENKYISAQSKKNSMVIPVMTQVLHGAIPGVGSSSLYHYYQSQIQNHSYEDSTKHTP